MGFFNRYPYTDMHELNLDWLLNKMRELEIEFDAFKVVNNITFSGQWDITKQYPAWTIVNDNNIGYVSIQPVPVGIVLTNTDYWAEVIDYSAQIAGMQNRIVALENTVGDNNSGLVKDVNDLQSDVNDLQALNNPIVLLISDSYGVSSVTPLRYSWFDRFELLSNMEVKKGALGGASFCGNNVNSYLDVLNNIISTLTDEEKERVQHIIIGGGYNDAMYAGTYADEIAAINTFKSACSIFTNLKNINFYFIGATSDINNMMQMYFKRLELEKALVTQGISYNYIGNVLHDYDDNIQSDKIHPTNEGALLIGSSIKAIFENKAAKIEPTFSALYTLSCTDTSVADMTMREFTGNGKVVFALADTTFTKGAADANPLIFLLTSVKGLALPVKAFKFSTYMIINGTPQLGIVLIDTYSDNSLRVVLRPLTSSPWNTCKIDFNCEIDDYYC